jgi:hypothetical protein
VDDAALHARPIRSGVEAHVRHLRALFPHEYVSLNLIDGLPVNGSRFDGAAIIDTTLRRIAAGKVELGPGFAVHADGLGPSTTNMPPGVCVRARCGSAVTGIQTHAPSREGPLTTADLEPAFSASVDFVQVYQSSVGDGLRERDRVSFLLHVHRGRGDRDGARDGP